MTAAVVLLDQLRERGVELWRDGDLLRYSAPAGVMTAELMAELRARKLELLEYLRPYPCECCGQFSFPVASVTCYWCRQGRTP